MAEVNAEPEHVQVRDNIMAQHPSTTELGATDCGTGTKVHP